MSEKYCYFMPRPPANEVKLRAGRGIRKYSQNSCLMCCSAYHSAHRILNAIYCVVQEYSLYPPMRKAGDISPDKITIYNTLL